MSKAQLLQELVDAYEKLIGTAIEAAQRGVTRQGDTWGPREIVAHLAGWEVMATVRIPRIAAGMSPLEEADEARQALRFIRQSAIFRTILPRMWPSRLSSWACRACSRGNTFPI